MNRKILFSLCAILVLAVSSLFDLRFGKANSLDVSPSNSKGQLQYPIGTKKNGASAPNHIYLPLIKIDVFDESQVRYIMADLQLGGVTGYYRKLINQPSVTEALRRWDAGFRVANITQFERKVEGANGWQVVFAGTDTLINGMDVVLTTNLVDEANVRYILADSQLGGVIDYYRQFLGQPSVAEAVRRWDAGVRVVNITQFERKVEGANGWQVVYAGTDTLINGMDVYLTAP